MNLDFFSPHNTLWYGSTLCARSWSLFCLTGEETKYNWVSSSYRNSAAHTDLVMSVHRSSSQTAFWFCGLPLVVINLQRWFCNTPAASSKHTHTHKEEKQKHPSGFWGDLCGLRKWTRNELKGSIWSQRILTWRCVLAGKQQLVSWSLPDVEVTEAGRITGGIAAKGRSAVFSPAWEACVCLWAGGRTERERV